jgi:hypothetical protein
MSLHLKHYFDNQICHKGFKVQISGLAATQKKKTYE